MRVGVGYSDNPDSTAAGMQAAQSALAQTGRGDPCDLVLLFATSRHDPQVLRDAVSMVVGDKVPVVGGGAVGIISNTSYGYAGDQVGLAAFWMDDIAFNLQVEGGLQGDEAAVGIRLGDKLKAGGIKPESPVLLFYDAIDRSKGGMRLVLATPLLAGVEQSMGFLPAIVGAGLQGDYTLSPTKQWTGKGIEQHTTLALSFGAELHVDSVILHGCRPSTGYFTVTKAEGQTILEINGQPALKFMQELLGPSIAPEDYPFFLIFGVNRGDKWGDFDEKIYANRLCLAIDKERDGIVMFEPDMVAGTVFQVMHRALDLDYMAPKLHDIFDCLDSRKPVFALYIDCAGRAAGYAGTDLEDALVVQKVVADRVPVLGIYSGVEIAPVMGKSRTLDWTGVFCLFSVPL